MGFLDYAMLVVYLLLMIAIGIRTMGRNKTQDDFFLGGRSFGKLLQTFAAFGAGTGAQDPIMVGRTVWTSGLSGVWSAMLWLFVTPMYWITATWYRRMRHLTLGDWFVERYESRALGAAFTLYALVFYMFYLSTMLSAIAKFAVPLLGYESVLGVEIKYILVPILAATVVCYGVLGGLTAAYWTDLIQGILIIVLSVILIPFGLSSLVARFGDPRSEGLEAGFRYLHEQMPADFFSLFHGPSAGEFSFAYIVSLTLLGLVGIVVHPHFIATGGGSAKSENAARVGLVMGNFLKRLCTVGWAFTGLIALALFAGNAEIAADPDRVWGVASREILGPYNLGLVGLMFACLMAAMMSSADAYMLVCSALVVRNVYTPYFRPSATERQLVTVGRWSSSILIVGASGLALLYADVFGQFKMAIEIPIIFAAPFWVGLYWRRVNTTAVWLTMLVSLLLFFVLPVALPAWMPSLRTHPAFSATTPIVTSVTTRAPTEIDSARYTAWEEARNKAGEIIDNTLRQAAIARLGPKPPNPSTRQIEVTTRTGGQAIYWQNGVTSIGKEQLEVVRSDREEDREVIVEKYIGPMQGKGAFNLDFIIYRWIGIDLSEASKATLEALRLPTRLFLPFLVLIGLSWITPSNRKEVLDRYYVKMKTVVERDPAADRAALEESYQSPQRFDHLKLFPGTQLEFCRPRLSDVFGVLISFAVCFAIIGLLVWLAGFGG